MSVALPRANELLELLERQRPVRLVRVVARMFQLRGLHQRVSVWHLPRVDRPVVVALRRLQLVGTSSMQVLLVVAQLHCMLEEFELRLVLFPGTTHRRFAA